MSNKIAEIRARHKLADSWRGVSNALWTQVHDDRATLLAEVERLQEKLLDLWAGNRTHSAALDRAEVERLRAERDTLLLDAREFLRWVVRFVEFTGNPTCLPIFPEHPWRAMHDRLNAHAGTLAALDATAKTDKEDGR